MSTPAAGRRAEYERELAAYIARVVAEAPPLNREQSNALALLFRRPRDTRAAA